MARVKRRQMEEADRRPGAATLGDLETQGIDVFCWCNRCGHNSVVETARLLSELGPAFPVPDVGSRLRCSGCGGRDIASRPAWASLGQVARHD
jgi:hypothetical protein